MTLIRGVEPTEILSRVDPTDGCSVKDSFADLDLAPYGFEILFSARWIVRQPPSAPMGRTLAQLGWERIEQPDALDRWVRAHGLVDAFRPDLLHRRDVGILGRRVADHYVAGAIALGHQGVVGLSNVFSRDGDPVANYAAAVDAALACFSGRPVVGYEHAEALDNALAAGFSVVGPLRVWLKS